VLPPLPLFGADEVCLVMPAGSSDRCSAWQRAAERHELRIDTLAGPRTSRTLRIKTEDGLMVALVHLAAPGPGEYTLVLHGLVAHPTNEVGRFVDLYVVGRPRRLTRIKDSGPDTDEFAPGDLPIRLRLAARP